MNLQKKFGALQIGVFAFMMVLFLTDLAFATGGGGTNGFAGIGTNIGNQTTGWADGAMKVGFFIGLILVIASVATFATMKKTNVQASIPVMMLAAGIILVSLGAFVTSGSETIWNNDESTAIQTHLGLNNF